MTNKITHNNNYKIPEHLNNYCSFDCDEKQCSNNNDCKKKLTDNDEYGWGFCNGKFGYGLKFGIPYINCFNFFNINYPYSSHNIINNTNYVNLSEQQSTNNININDSDNLISDSDNLISDSDNSFFDTFSED